MLQFGLNNTIIEPCVFFNGKIKILLYVDDGLVFGSPHDVKDILQKLQLFFSVKVMNYPKTFLGISITKKEGSLHLDLSDYLSKIQKENNTVTSFKSKTPMSTTYDISNDDTELLSNELITEYQKLIGILTYCTSTIRVSLCYPTNLSTRQLKSPTLGNFKQAKKILNFAIASKFEGNDYKKEDVLKVKVIEPDFMKEKEVDIIKLNDKITITTVTDATWADSKSELTAVCYGTRHALYMRNLLNELNIAVNPLKIVNDNQSALMMGTHSTGRNKHIEIKYFFTRQLVENGNIKLYYIQTSKNVADQLTKNLEHNQYNLFINKIMN